MSRGGSSALPAGRTASLPLLLLLLSAACGWALGAGCATIQRSPGEALIRSKCGACHLRPARGERTRSELEGVLQRHRRRLDLDAGQRRQIVEHLSGAAGQYPSP